MSNNKQQVELTDITVSSPVATHGLTMEDRAASIGFLLDCAERGQNRGRQRPPSIHKVPRILSDLSVRSFIPQLVSIGPIHREDPKLKEFERRKEDYLADLLNRCEDSTPKETILEACLLKVNTLLPKIKESYAGMIKYHDAELATVMVMDGCFILEFCFKHNELNLRLPTKMQINTRIAMDLMLLENQVPFSVLQALFDCLMGKFSFTLSQVLDTYLAPYIKLFRGKNSTTDVDSDSTTDVDSDSTPAHVLGYLHKRYQLIAAKSSKPIHTETSKLLDEQLAAKSLNPVDDEVFRGHTIVELDRSGMNFKPHQEDDWSMTIKIQFSFPCLFWSKATLLMPTLVIDDNTELILRNFIAYEQSFPQDHNYFTSYAHAMDKLIDTQEDIAKLVKSEVLVNGLGTNQEAADMINKICKNMYLSDFCYDKAFKQMDRYYHGVWPTTFRNPWNAISLLFGFIVSITTVVSAIFTILEYFR